jgi:hypothetical protein
LFYVGGANRTPISRFFQRALAIIPPHQQLFHEALFNKFDLPNSFSQKNNGRVISMALMPTGIGIAFLHDRDFAQLRPCF